MRGGIPDAQPLQSTRLLQPHPVPTYLLPLRWANDALPWSGRRLPTSGQNIPYRTEKEE